MLPAIAPCSRRLPTATITLSALPPWVATACTRMPHFSVNSAASVGDSHRQQPRGSDLPHHRAIRSACSRSRSIWLRLRLGRFGILVRPTLPGWPWRFCSSTSGRAARTSIPVGRPGGRPAPSGTPDHPLETPTSTLRLDLPAGAVRRGTQPLDAAFGLARAGIEVNDERFKRGTITFQNAQGALQPDGLEQCRAAAARRERFRGSIP